MSDFSKIVVALLTLTLIAVVVASGQTAAFIKGAGGFLSASASKVVNS